MKQTAVEWFQEQIIKIVNGTCELSEIQIFEQAKEMEKEQMIKNITDYNINVTELILNPLFNLEHSKHGIACEKLSDIRNQFINDHTGETNEMVEPIKHNLEKIISQAHTKITRRKGKDYAPTSNDIQKEIDAVSSQTEMSNESWEGCNGCTEQDEIMYKNGYAKGYNAAISDLPKEISDEEITKLANEYILYNDSKRQWVIEGMKLYREQLINKL